MRPAKPPMRRVERRFVDSSQRDRKKLGHGAGWNPARRSSHYFQDSRKAMKMYFAVGGREFR